MDLTDLRSTERARYYELDVNSFITYLQKLAPKSARLKLTAAKMFLFENKVELPQLFWRRANKHIKGSRALTIDRVPENNELRKIVSHMPIHGRLLVLMPSSSGMRIGEGLRLKLQDVQAAGDVLRIKIPGAIMKTGNSRITFASRETKEVLEEWLKVRDRYLQGAVGKSHFYAKAETDDRIFPFLESTAARLLTGSLTKTGMTERDQTTNRRLAHWHVLRKFFRTKLGSVIQSDVVEALMGHEEGLTEVYRKYSEKDLLKAYTEGEHALLLFGDTSGEASALRTEVNRVYRENYELRSGFDNMRKENEDLKERIRRTEQKLDQVMSTVDALQREVSDKLS